MMHPHRIAAILLRQFYLVRGSPARLLPLFVWAGVDIVLWGFITRYLNTVTSPGLNFVPVLLGAVLLWDFFTRVMYGVTTTFLEDVWSRNFLYLFATPLSISEYLAGMVISSIVTSSIGLVVMLALAILVFGLSFFVYGLALIPFLLVLFLFGIALGILAIATVLRYGPAAEWFIWPLPAVLSPFAAVFYPPRRPAPVDAARLAPAAAVVRLRVHADDPGARTGLLDRPVVERITRHRIHPPGRLVLHPHLPPRRPHRTHRPLQRRNPLVRPTETCHVGRRPL